MANDIRIEEEFKLQASNKNLNQFENVPVGKVLEKLNELINKENKDSIDAVRYYDGILDLMFTFYVNTNRDIKENKNEQVRNSNPQTTSHPYIMNLEFNVVLDYLIRGNDLFKNVYGALNDEGFKLIAAYLVSIFLMYDAYILAETNRKYPSRSINIYVSNKYKILYNICVDIMLCIYDKSDHVFDGFNKNSNDKFDISLVVSGIYNDFQLVYTKKYFNIIYNHIENGSPFNVSIGDTVEKFFMTVLNLIFFDIDLVHRNASTEGNTYKILDRSMPIVVWNKTDPFTVNGFKVGKNPVCCIVSRSRSVEVQEKTPHMTMYTLIKNINTRKNRYENLILHHKLEESGEHGSNLQITYYGSSPYQISPEGFDGNSYPTTNITSICDYIKKERSAVLNTIFKHQVESDSTYFPQKSTYKNNYGKLNFTKMYLSEDSNSSLTKKASTHKTIKYYAEQLCAVKLTGKQSFFQQLELVPFITIMNLLIFGALLQKSRGIMFGEHTRWLTEIITEKENKIEQTDYTFKDQLRFSLHVIRCIVTNKPYSITYNIKYDTDTPEYPQYELTWMNIFYVLKEDVNKKSFSSYPLMKSKFTENIKDELSDYNMVDISSNIYLAIHKTDSSKKLYIPQFTHSLPVALINHHVFTMEWGESKAATALGYDLSGSTLQYVVPFKILKGGDFEVDKDNVIRTVDGNNQKIVWDYNLSSKLKHFLNNLNEITDNFTVWRNEVDNYYQIDFHNSSLTRVTDAKKVDSKAIFCITYSNDEFTLKHSGKEYNIVFNTGGSHLNNYIFGVRNAFIVNDKQNTHHKKIFIMNKDNKKIKDKLKNFNKTIGKKFNDVYVDYEFANKFYFIDIHSNGMTLQFGPKDKNAFLSYYIATNLFMKDSIFVMDIIYSSGFQYLPDNVVKESLYDFIQVPHINRYRKKYYMYNSDDENINTKYDPENMQIVSKKPLPIQLKKSIHKLLEVSSKFAQFISVPDDKYPNNDILKKIRDNLLYKGDTFENENDTEEHHKLVKCETTETFNKDAFVNSICDAEKNFKVTLNNLINTGPKDDQDCDYMYNIIRYNKIIQMCRNMYDIAVDDDKERLCNELNAAMSIFDPFHAYMGERDGHVQLFEGYFGWLIRRDQYEAYIDIIREIDGENGQYNVRQMLMGKGKTSVLTPLIVFHYVYDSSNKFNSIVIVLPPHLIEQTYSSFVSQYANVLPNTRILKMKIDRISQSDIKDDKSDKSKNYFGNDKFKSIIITTITSLQSIILNHAELNGKNENILKKNKEETLYIFDEFDSIADPLSNELNYPKDVYTPKLINNKGGNKDIFHFIFDCVEYLYKNGYAEYLAGNDIKFAIDNATQKARDDTVIQPQRKIGEGIGESSSGSSSGRVKKDRVIYPFQIEKVRKSLEVVTNKIPDKDYGRDPVNADKLLAIPYKGVNHPIIGSEFSDFEIKCAFTIAMYLINGLEDRDIPFLRDVVTSEYMMVRTNKEQYENSYILKLFNYLNKAKTFDGQDILLEDHIVNFDFSKFLKEEPKDARNEIICQYLLKVVYRQISLFDTQYKCSFVDVAGNTFSKYKIGFTGTVTRIVTDIYKEDTEPHIFSDIKPDNIAESSIYSGLIGYVQKEKAKVVLIKSNELEEIVKMVVDGNYDCLIDTGALLRNHSSKEVVEKIRELYEKKNISYKKYIYINRHDKEDYIPNNIHDNLKDMFIYYDQKHTVGTDVSNQPYMMKGLVTINTFNQYTDVSQGVFRLRKINYGHAVDFVVYNKSNSMRHVTDEMKLLEHLLKKDEEYKDSTLKHAAQQQLMYLKRKTSNNDGAYVDTVYREMNMVHELGESKLQVPPEMWQVNEEIRTQVTNTPLGDLYNRFVDEHFCKDGTQEKLCEIIKGGQQNLLGTEQQQQQQQETEQEIAQRLEGATINLPGVRYLREISDYEMKYYLDTEKWSDFPTHIFNNSHDRKEYNKLNKKNIYLSRLFDDGIFDIFSNFMEGDDKDHLNNNLIEGDLFRHYGYYIVKKDDNLLIIKGHEANKLHSYLKEKKINDIILYNKTGTPIYGVPSLGPQDARLIFLKYILGTELRLYDRLMAIVYVNQYKLDMFEFYRKYLMTVNEKDPIKNEIIKLKDKDAEEIVKYVVNQINDSSKLSDDEKVFHVIEISNEFVSLQSLFNDKMKEIFNMEENKMKKLHAKYEERLEEQKQREERLRQEEERLRQEKEEERLRAEEERIKSERKEREREEAKRKNLKEKLEKLQKVEKQRLEEERKRREEEERKRREEEERKRREEEERKRREEEERKRLAEEERKQREKRKKPSSNESDMLKAKLVQKIAKSKREHDMEKYQKLVQLLNMYVKYNDYN